MNTDCRCAVSNEIICIDTGNESNRWYILPHNEGVFIASKDDGYLKFKNKDKLEKFIEQLIKVRDKLKEKNHGEWYPNI